MNPRPLLLLFVVLATLAAGRPAPASAREGWVVDSVNVEGLPKGIGKVVGNLGLSARTGLLGAGPPAFHEQTLEADRRRLLLLLARNGYPYASVTHQIEPVRGKQRVKVRLIVAPGRPVIYAAARVEGAPPELVELAALTARTLRQGAVFTDAGVRAAGRQAALNLARAGYALADVTTRVERPDSFTAIPVFVLTPGRRHRITELAVTGVADDLVPLARKSMGVEPGALYSPDLLAGARDNLRELRLFRQIRVATAPSLPEELVLTADLKAAAPRSARVSVGRWSDDPIRLRAGWQHRNLFRKGRGLGFSGAYSPYFQELGGRVWWPALLGPRSVVELRTGWFREDEESYELENRSLEGVIQLRPADRLTLRLGAALEDVLVNGTGDDVSDFTGPDGRMLVLSFRAYDDRSDHLLYPTRGMRLTLDTALSPGGDFSAAPFASAEGKAVGYLPLPAGMVLASRAALGLAKPLEGSDSLLPNRRFFAGGVTTMRGYKRRRLGPVDGDDDPIGGEARLLLSAELRTPLTGWLEVASFLDAGQVWEERADLALADLATAVGAGLVVHTPVGPVRLDFAHLIDEPRAEESRNIIHLAIGHPF